MYLELMELAEEVAMVELVKLELPFQTLYMAMEAMEEMAAAAAAAEVEVTPLSELEVLAVPVEMVQPVLLDVLL